MLTKKEFCFIIFFFRYFITLVLFSLDYIQLSCVLINSCIYYSIFPCFNYRLYWIF
ncbi:hypothetical protein C2G38_2086105 [Gigaspora rosea]|uniref:Uncharacterized protein n=1 Tax=Gigaspora rosea TaxID=44941 RepID=A0A397V7D0_9GLOM|nr:hypothetical protein C2G38_2086105 [Gigaspora rosea]